MLRVHAHRFARRDAKEERVELVHRVNKGPGPRIHLARGRAAWVIKIVQAPTFGRHFPDQIGAALEQLPERFGRIRPR